MKRTHLLEKSSAFAEVTADSHQSKKLCESSAIIKNVSDSDRFLAVDTYGFNAEILDPNWSGDHDANEGCDIEKSHSLVLSKNFNFKFWHFNAIGSDGKPIWKDSAAQAKRYFTLFWCTFAKHSFN